MFGHQPPTPKNSHYKYSPHPTTYDNEARWVSVSTVAMVSTIDSMHTVNSMNSMDDHFRMVIKEFTMKGENNYVDVDDMNQTLINGEMAADIY